MPPWVAQLATEPGPVDATISNDELQLEDLRLVDLVAAVEDVVERPEIINVKLENADIAGFTAREGRAERVLVSGGRFRGVTWAGGILQDVIVDSAACADISFRFSTLRRVTFRNCELPGADFTEVTFDQVRFEDCVLAGAQLHRAKIKSLRIEGCDMTGATGVEALSGASITPDDLLQLAPSLAAALGIIVEPITARD